MAYTGRKVIYTDESVITRDNVISVLNDAINTHSFNNREINYLYKYYKGDQPILNRIKEIRPEINNKVLVNLAYKIVNFKTGYLAGEPIQYVARNSDEKVMDQLKTLNDFVVDENKMAKDIQLADWMHICGQGYRIALPDDSDSIDDSPFEIYTLDPRSTFVVYWSGLGHKPIMGVTYATKTDGVTKVYSVYTKDTCFIVEGNTIVSELPHYLGMIPIIEYPSSEARLGAFEIVLSLLDAINTVESNRLDGVEQFVQALMVFKNVDVDEDMFKKIRELGGICVPEGGGVEYLVSELNQMETQTLKDNLKNDVFIICGIPSQSDGSSSESSNNGAVILKNGWQSAEALAKATETVFKEAEMSFIRLIVNIANTKRRMSIRPKDIDIRFTRRNYENIETKAKVLVEMLNNDKIHPKLAFEHSGVFSDPNLAYSQSKEYYDDVLKQEELRMDEFEETETDRDKDVNEDVRTDRQSD